MIILNCIIFFNALSSHPMNKGNRVIKVHAVLMYQYLPMSLAPPFTGVDGVNRSAIPPHHWWPEGHQWCG